MRKTTTNNQAGFQSQMPQDVKRESLVTEVLLSAAALTGFIGFYQAYMATLPRYVDDAERDFGTDIYDRMLRTPALAGAMGAIADAMLSEGVRFINRAAKPSDYVEDLEAQAKFDKGEEIRAWVEDQMDALQQPIETILEELLDALPFGHVVAEQTYEQDGGQLKLARLAVKPRDSYSFVVDEFMQVKGILPARTGAATSASGLVTNPEDILPREKFLHFAHQPKKGDPRGTSILRAAYNDWYLRMQTLPQYFKYLCQFGTPSVAVILGENQPSYIQATDGNGVVSNVPIEDSVLQKLLAFANGTALVLPAGSTMQVIEPQGKGEAYTGAFDLYDRQMIRAVLRSTRGVMEAEHGSKADSQTSQDLMGAFTQRVRRQVEACFYRDVLQPLVRYNYGDEIAKDLCPYLSLSDVSREDVAAVGDMIAKLASAGVIHPSQYEGIDAKLGLPERDPNAAQETQPQAVPPGTPPANDKQPGVVKMSADDAQIGILSAIDQFRRSIDHERKQRQGS